MQSFKDKQAFSLIELMVVIAIVALLAAVAVPNYAAYVGRAKVAEVNTIVGKFLGEWAENDSLGNTFTETTSSLGAYINQIQISDDTSGTASNPGTVDVTLNNPSDIDSVLDNLEIIYTPSTAGNTAVTWSCEYQATTSSNIATYFPDCTGL